MVCENEKLREKQQKCLALAQQSARLSAKVAPLVIASALLQEAMNLNQQLVLLANELSNEREAKNPDPHGGEVPPEARPSA